MDCLDENRLQALAAGGLQAPEAVLAHAHLDSCDTCRAALAAAARVVPAGLDSIASPPTLRTPPGRVAPGTDAAPLDAGSTVAGRYEVVRLLGRGGMGSVYEARHLQLGKPIALKVLLPELARDEQTVQRFLREGRAAAAINHPSIVEVFDLASDGPLTFIAMEKLDGEDLKARIHRSHPLDPRFVARVGAELADAIAAAHAHGVVHRDLKPANVFLANKGPQVDAVKVLDFGIAKLATAPGERATLTISGQVVGTPAYMAPEQMRGERTADARVDIYGIGALLYEALSGSPPFEADTLGALAFKVATDEPRPLAALRPGLPAKLVELVERAMKKDPAARTQTAAEVAAGLRAVLADASPELLWEPALAKTHPSGLRRQRTSKPWALAAAVFACLVAAAAWLGTREPPAAPAPPPVAVTRAPEPIAAAPAQAPAPAPAPVPAPAPAPAKKHVEPPPLLQR